MKRTFFLLIILLFLAGIFSGCIVLEEPEPTHTEPPFTGEREQVSFYSAGGINYRLYNDGTAEVDSLDPEIFTGYGVSIPDHCSRYPVVGIAEAAFEGSNITEVILPDGILTVGRRAFRQSAITAITLPDSVVFVGEDAFDACRDLAEAHLGAGLTSLSTGMFYGCDALKKIKLPVGVVSIGEECFSACTALSEITLPETVTEIGAYAFWNAGTDSLSFQIPQSVKEVGAGAFRGTAWLKRQSDLFVIVGDGVLLRYTGNDTEARVPDGVLYLSDAFSGTAVTRVILPASVTGECRDAWEESAVTEVIRES